MGRARWSLYLVLLTALSPGCKRSDTDTSAEFLGLDPAIAAQPGEARAGVIRDGTEGEAAIFGGINSEAKAGDIKLYNDRVQVVIQGAYPSHGFVDVAGTLIDADLVRESDVLGRDTIEDVFLSFGLSRLYDAQTVEIEADGGAGGSAVVVTRGTDVPWGLMQGMMELSSPLVDELNLEIEARYELPPDSYSVLISTTLTNTGTEDAVFVPQDGLISSGEDLLPWGPGAGIERTGDGPLESVIFVGRSGEATLAMWPDEGGYRDSAITDLAAELGIAIAEREPLVIPPGQTVELVRSLSIAPDAVTAEAERWSAQGQELGAVSGTVTDQSSGAGVPGARVHFVAGERVGGFALTDSEGAFAARLPPAEWTAWAVSQGDSEYVQLPAEAGRYGPFTASTVNQAQLDALSGSSSAAALPWAAGRPESEPQVFDLSTEGEQTLQIQVGAPGGLHVEIVDGAGQPLPGVLEVLWAAGAPPTSTVPAELQGALGVPDSSRAAWAWTSTGTIDLPAQPGTYTLTAGHSWRHEQQTQSDIEVTAGQITDVTLTLEQVVPRDSWLSADTHLHGAPSFDGALPMEDRLVVCASTGVDLPILTDHDRHADYRQLATALGLDPLMTTIPGAEVTTILRGHFNYFPIEPDPLGAVNGGAVAWWDAPANTEDLFDRMREAAGPDALIQVNHPRTPGMFAFARYDEETGEVRDPTFWSWDFELFEMLNGGVDDLDKLRADWFSFLALGHQVTPTGSSDSHYRYIPCGLGRTDVFLGTESPVDVPPEDLVDALLAGHVVVASGTTLRASLETAMVTALPGDTFVGTEATLEARVWAPSWMQPGTLRVYRNGEVIVEEELTEIGPTGMWFDGSWPMLTTEDAWYAIEVEGTEPMPAIWRYAKPYAMSNAFFVDADGNGWTAPGLP